MPGLGRPAGPRPERAKRAVVELAWAQLQTRAAAWLPIGEPAVDRDELRRLLPAPGQWLRLHWWGVAPARGDERTGTRRLGPLAVGVDAVVTSAPYPRDGPARPAGRQRSTPATD